MHGTRGRQLERRNGQAANRSFWTDALAEHESWLKQVIRVRVGEPQAVDEVWQDAACQVLARPSALSRPDNVAAWLYRVIVRQALLYRRKLGRQRQLLTRFAVRAGSASAPADPLTWLLVSERRRHVRGALNELPVRDAQLLVLKYTQDWSYLEIAEHLGLSVSAVEARLHRARARLRALLERLDPEEKHHEHA
jgi:RNA polymerase sigma-70 factor (ECF subfamily)